MLAVAVLSALSLLGPLSASLARQVPCVGNGCGNLDIFNTNPGYAFHNKGSVPVSVHVQFGVGLSCNPASDFVVQPSQTVRYLNNVICGSVSATLQTPPAPQPVIVTPAPQPPPAPPTSPTTTNAPAAAGAILSQLLSDARDLYKVRSDQIMASVNKLPEDKLNTKLSDSTIRSQLVWLAQTTIWGCEDFTNLHIPSPVETGHETKAQLISMLSQSFTVCKDILANLQPAGLGESVTWVGSTSPQRRTWLLLMLMDHIGEDAVAVDGYLEAAGIEP